MGFQSKFTVNQVDPERFFYREQFDEEIRKEIELLKARVSQLELRLEDPFG